MDDLVDIRNLLSDSIDRYIREQYSFEQRRELIATPEGFSKEHWQTFAELGWLKLPFARKFGGFNGSAADLQTVMHQFGRALVMNPYLYSVVIASYLIESAASRRLADDLLDEVGKGESIVAYAATEEFSGYDANVVTTTATPDEYDHQYLINGRKDSVAYGNVANRIIVVARTNGKITDRFGLSLFVMPSSAYGIKRTDFETHDGGRVSSITFKDTPAILIGKENMATQLIEQVNNRAAVAICAEMSGAMWALYEQTLEYLKTRTQFGTTIGSLQALQHRMVEIYMQCELAQSLATDAARAIDDLQGSEQDALVSAAKWQVGEAAVQVAEEAIQLHGAMGMMDELPIGHYLKRITSLNQQFGNSMYHQSRYRQIITS